MKRGIVMELHQGNAVLMDGTGEIAGVSAHPDWRLGDTVPFPRRHGPVGRFGLIAAALLLVLGASLFAGAYFTPYSLVSLDVNPSVELALNRFDYVISARAMNEEGAALLGLSAVENKRAAEALGTLLGGGYLAPYLGAEADITLTVQGGSPQKEAALLNRMDAVAEEALRYEGRGLRIHCLGVDRATVAAAHGCGVTAGKYLALLELQAADPNVDIRRYAHCTIGEIKEETARCAGHGGQGGGRGPGHGHGKGHR